ncbi:four helix bundle protein [Empedobacter brevis]|uniref:four helix bundle protein n=1 Tax=Empedobacter brevis TaxID=247 RepID=UPI002899C671|nr:four helix bundle protein [Empedobacter brevis]
MSYYKNLHIWIKAMELVNFIYGVTKSFPKDEIFGLTNQIKRSAVSIPSNIAEGAGRNSNQQFIHFLSIANGSLLELETQLLIAKNQNYVSGIELNKCLELIEDIQKMNYKFQSKLKEAK